MFPEYNFYRVAPPGVANIEWSWINIIQKQRDMWRTKHFSPCSSSQLVLFYTCNGRQWHPHKVSMTCWPELFFLPLVLSCCQNSKNKKNRERHPRSPALVLTLLYLMLNVKRPFLCAERLFMITMWPNPHAFKIIINILYDWTFVFGVVCCYLTLRSTWKKKRVLLPSLESCFVVFFQHF